MSNSDVPRRIRLDKFTPAERAIYDAVQAVEGAGCDRRLTEAVVLLCLAREKVADYVEGVDTQPTVTTPPTGFHPDYRCSDCAPGSPILKDGYVCSAHQYR